MLNLLVHCLGYIPDGANHALQRPAFPLNHFMIFKSLLSALRVLPAHVAELGR